VSEKALAFPPLKDYGLVEQSVCGLGSPFASRTTEWFTPEMVRAQPNQAQCRQLDSVQLPPDSGAVILGNSPFTTNRKPQR
jgi:hypothetical protein